MFRTFSYNFKWRQTTVDIRQRLQDVSMAVVCSMQMLSTSTIQ